MRPWNAKNKENPSVVIVRRIAMQAEEILRKNKQQYVASLLQKGFISQMEEDYRSGRYTVTNKTRTLAETWY